MTGVSFLHPDRTAGGGTYPSGLDGLATTQLYRRGVRPYGTHGRSRTHSFPSRSPHGGPRGRFELHGLRSVCKLCSVDVFDASQFRLSPMNQNTMHIALWSIHTCIHTYSHPYIWYKHTYIHASHYLILHVSRARRAGVTAGSQRERLARKIHYKQIICLLSCLSPGGNKGI